MDRWTRKVALVTGASAGIGAAAAVELANHGMKVVAIARRLDKVEALKERIKGSGELFPLTADVSKEEDINTIFNWIKSKFGAIHVLINNAGVYRPGLITDLDPKFFKEVMDVNVMGLTLCAQQAIKLMRDAGVDDGHIININSIAGHRVMTREKPFTNLYAASKFAVTAITESLRQELRYLKTKIRVTSISPGYVSTEIMMSGAKAVDASTNFLDNFLGTPALEPQDIADAIVYVLGTPPRVQIHELTIKPVGEHF